jgi:hypothetical protein
MGSLNAAASNRRKVALDRAGPTRQGAEAGFSSRTPAEELVGTGGKRVRTQSGGLWFRTEVTRGMRLA